MKRAEAAALVRTANRDDIGEGVGSRESDDAARYCAGVCGGGGTKPVCEHAWVRKKGG